VSSKRRRLLAALGGLAIAASLSAGAESLDDIQKQSVLKIAVYNDFPPYSFAGHGIDVDLGAALADRLGVKPEIIWFNAGEDMSDDLRNMVWKGHYLGGRLADVMMHVPVDARFAEQNDKVSIFGIYHLESVALARDPAKVPAPVGSAAIALEVFTREKVGVELATLADSFLLGTLNGRLKDNVVHYRSVALAVAGLKAGEVAAVMAPRTEIEAAIANDPRFPVAAVQMPELRVNGWALGMAVKSDSPRLAQALGQTLETLQQDGTVDKIFSHYDVSHRIPQK
jgi:ABC-type amino acid transport substrate-binding protein